LIKNQGWRKTNTHLFAILYSIVKMQNKHIENNMLTDLKEFPGKKYIFLADNASRLFKITLDISNMVCTTGCFFFDWHILMSINFFWKLKYWGLLFCKQFCRLCSFSAYQKPAGATSEMIMTDKNQRVVISR